MAEKLTLQLRPRANAIHGKTVITGALHRNRPKLKRSLTADPSLGNVDEKRNTETIHVEVLQEKKSQVNLNMFSPRLRASTWEEEIKIVPHSAHSPSERINRNTHEPEAIGARTSQERNAQACSDVRAFQETESAAKFCNTRIKEIITKVLASHLDNLAEFCPRTCAEKCRLISQMIENGVKSLCSSQYKVMALVYIGAIRDQGIELASQCYWCPNSDHFTMATYKNDSLYASGIVFATVYYD